MLAGCPTVTPVREIHSATTPDISRVMLKSGTVITFNQDFGWFNQKAGTIEGVTTDSLHVEYHLVELKQVETVGTYSLLAAVGAAHAVLLGGAGLVGVAGAVAVTGTAGASAAGGSRSYAPSCTITRLRAARSRWITSSSPCV